MGSIVGVGINVNQISFPKNFNATSMKIIIKKVMICIISKKLIYMKFIMVQPFNYVYLINSKYAV